MKTRFCITKWCKSISDSGKDEYTGRYPIMRKHIQEDVKAEGITFPPVYDFRLLDGDGIIYAYGKCTDDSSFAPLDRYMPDYGCVEIQYKNPKTGRYETL